RSCLTEQADQGRFRRRRVGRIGVEDLTRVRVAGTQCDFSAADVVERVVRLRCLNVGDVDETEPGGVVRDRPHFHTSGSHRRQYQNSTATGAEADNVTCDRAGHSIQSSGPSKRSSPIASWPSWNTFRCRTSTPTCMPSIPSWPILCPGAVWVAVAPSLNTTRRLPAGAV